MQRRIGILGMAAVLTACGAGNPTDDPSGSAEQSVIRGTPEKGLPQVVLLQTTSYYGKVKRCSGAYIGPRMVLTAAHCFSAPPAGVSMPDLNFVYFGDNYAADVAQLPNIPPPGQPSKWARVESLVAHPDYNATLNHPDIAVVYLDRLLPFMPLPLQRQPVSDAWIGKLAEIVGWGADQALKPDLSQVSGVGVKRSGFAPIAGTPTEADYHADDPNPGMLDPNIRAHTLKLIGTAPNANPCAGDSGSPLLLKPRGFNQIAGVSFWTGLSCEDYAIYTRIDPFLPFIDGSFRYVGLKPIVPSLSCVEEKQDGSLRAYFGYQNQNRVSITIPPNPFTNYFPKDTARARPTVFRPGTHATVFGVDFAAGDTLYYRLIPPAGPKTELRVDASAPRCTAMNAACIRACAAQTAGQCDPPVVDPRQPFDACVNDCVFFGTGWCEAEWNAYNECVGQLSPDPANWFCMDGMIPWNVAPAGCQDEYYNYLFCPG
jgi:hypothetical protein